MYVDVEKKDSLGHPMECFAWIAVFDGSQLGVARTASFTLPNIIRDLIMEEGMELGDADDHGNHNDAYLPCLQ